MKSSYRNRKNSKSTAKVFIVILILVACAISPSVKNKFFPPEEKDYGQITEQEQPINASDKNKNEGETKNEDSNHSNAQEVSPYSIVKNNNPDFSKSELERAKKSYKKFSELDSLGRCGTAIASIGKDSLPTEKRGSIGMVKPSGWHTVRYDDLISDKYLYNRCHLIAYCLSGENANEKNLITGTRYMNVSGMLPFEEKVLDYVAKTGNRVLYQVTPDFKGDNLVASGVYMKAKSVEDNGKGLSFNVYVKNQQPGIKIDYKTGDSERL